MGQLGTLITEYMDGQRYRPTNADIAREVGVSRGTIGNWIVGTSRLPEADHLRQLARLIGQPYPRVLDAALADAGYLLRAGEGHAGPASNTPRVTEVTPIGQSAKQHETGARRRRPGTPQGSSQG